MKETKALDKLDIISYKHDGELHRVWKNVDKVFESDESIIIINNEVDVIDGDGRKWKTREPAVCYFYKKYWFNIICMLRNDAIYYYCNLSSPYVVDKEGIKYIDYDLDVKVYPGGDIIDLDEDEFSFNTRYLHYSPDIIHIIKRNRAILKGIIARGEEPFNSESVYAWYNLYLSQNPDAALAKIENKDNLENQDNDEKDKTKYPKRKPKDGYRKNLKNHKFHKKNNFKKFKKSSN